MYNKRTNQTYDAGGHLASQAGDTLSTLLKNSKKKLAERASSIGSFALRSRLSLRCGLRNWFLREQTPPILN